uniref:Uncharacterized protein n=1 Tax=uncultured verrucomicrobium HF0500_08N17 TaxID=723597 RepID=E7C4X3_9BACT|nr:hypothetical protein [uncultured verrucomicrobium HF0500_08N17]
MSNSATLRIPVITSPEKVLEMSLKIRTLGPMARVIIEETEVMAIRLSPVGEINLHAKNLALLQSVRKMNFFSRKLAENQAGSWHSRG